MQRQRGHTPLSPPPPPRGRRFVGCYGAGTPGHPHHPFLSGASDDRRDIGISSEIGGGRACYSPFFFSPRSAKDTAMDLFSFPPCDRGGENDISPLRLFRNGLRRRDFLSPAIFQGSSFFFSRRKKQSRIIDAFRPAFGNGGRRSVFFPPPVSDERVDTNVDHDPLRIFPVGEGRPPRPAWATFLFLLPPLPTRGHCFTEVALGNDGKIPGFFCLFPFLPPAGGR